MMYNTDMREIIIITGASSGMGACFARQLVNENCEMWLIARRKERLEELSKELNEKRTALSNENPVKAIAMDISGRKGVEEFESFLHSANSREELKIAYLINNAGFGTYGTFADTPLKPQLDMIDTNCTALTGLCGVCLSYLREGSTIINVASLASFLPLGNFAVYGATKAFVLSFSIALAAELSDRKIKVCALCPGPVSTEFANVASAGARKEVLHGKSAEKVVEHCLKCARKNKKIAIMAFKWKFKAFASTFVKRYHGALFTYRYCKRPRNN